MSTTATALAADAVADLTLAGQEIVVEPEKAREQRNRVEPPIGNGTDVVGARR